MTSDDGFKNNLDAAKILDRYEIKGCFFISPSSIGLKEFKSVKKFFECKNIQIILPLTTRNVENIISL